MVENSNDAIFTGIAFLGGITLTSLFFVMQNPTFSNNLLLFTPLVMASMLFILATIGRLNVANDRIPKGSKFSTAISVMTVIGLYMLLFSLLQIFAKFNPVISIIGFAVLTIGWVILNKLAEKCKKPKNEPL